MREEIKDLQNKYWEGKQMVGDVVRVLKEMFSINPALFLRDQPEASWGNAKRTDVEEIECCTHAECGKYYQHQRR